MSSSLSLIGSISEHGWAHRPPFCGEKNARLYICLHSPSCFTPRDNVSRKFLPIKLFLDDLISIRQKHWGLRFFFYFCSLLLFFETKFYVAWTYWTCSSWRWPWIPNFCASTSQVIIETEKVCATVPSLWAMCYDLSQGFVHISQFLCASIFLKNYQVNMDMGKEKLWWSHTVGLWRVTFWLKILALFF